MIGNDDDNILIGSSEGDEFSTEFGQDIVFGGGGDHTINGGTRRKEFFGDAGNDTIHSSGVGR